MRVLQLHDVPAAAVPEPSSGSSDGRREILQKIVPSGTFTVLAPFPLAAGPVSEQPTRARKLRRAGARSLPPATTLLVRKGQLTNPRSLSFHNYKDRGFMSLLGACALRACDRLLVESGRGKVLTLRRFP